jgi:hypothetical protein
MKVNDLSCCISLDWFGLIILLAGNGWWWFHCTRPVLCIASYKNTLDRAFCGLHICHDFFLSYQRANAECCMESLAGTELWSKLLGLTRPRRRLASVVLDLRGLQYTHRQNGRYCNSYIFKREKNSVAGTRTRVSRVRAEYPNQLDYNGFVASQCLNYLNQEK